MGKRLNALLGRTSKSKLTMLANLAVSRIAILANLHGVRCSQARSDVIQLLRQPHHQHALLRVEQVIKEENTLDALVMIEMCCHILGESTEIITNSRECPDEVKEAVSSLIFAASRTGEFPELQEIRRVFTSKYGKELAYNAVELRHNCRVYPKLIEKLSTERVSLEARRNMLKQIAEDGGIALNEVEFIGGSRNMNLQQGNEKFQVTRMKDDYHEAVYRDGEAAVEDAFESADRSDSSSAMSGSDDEEITENPNTYSVEKNAKMSGEKKIFDEQGMEVMTRQGKTIAQNT